MLLSVTHMLCVSQVCHGVSHCVKDGSCSSLSLEYKNSSGDEIESVNFYAVSPGSYPNSLK